MANATDKSRLERLLGTVADIAIVAVAILIGVVVYQNRHRLFREAPPPAIVAGERLTLDEVDFSRNDKTYLLVISTNCSFCTQSAEFYKTLAQAASERPGVALVAALPQPVTEGRAYLEGLGVPVSGVFQVSLPALGVRGTPTILLTDSQGVVQGVWEAKLDPDGEQDVLNSMSL